MTEADLAKTNRRVVRRAVAARAMVLLALPAGIAWLWMRATICWQEGPLGALSELACAWFFLLPVCLLAATAIELALIPVALASLGRLAGKSDPSETYQLSIRFGGRARVHWWLYHVTRGYGLVEVGTREAVRSAMRWCATAASVLAVFLPWYLWEVSPLRSLGSGALAIVVAIIIWIWLSRISKDKPIPGNLPNQPVTIKGTVAAPGS